MQHRLFYAVAGLVLSVTVSCIRKPENNALVDNNLFNLDSLITGQIQSLKKLNVTVDRESNMNGNSDKVNFKPDTAFWHKEFEIFIAADIDKPALSGMYSISRSDSAGINFVNYNSINPKIDGTSRLSIGRDSAGRIVKVIIIEQNRSLIFRGIRNMVMNLQYNKAIGKNIISGYRVFGYQKIILRKKVNYNINVSLNWPDKPGKGI